MNTASPGGDSCSAESDDHEGEARDTLCPLPADLEAHHHHDDGEEDMSQRVTVEYLQQEQQQQHSIQTSSAGVRNTTLASERRSVNANSGRPIFPVRNATKQDLIHARKLLEAIQKEHGFVVPDRGNLDDPTILWKEGKPDYTIADLHYLLGKTKNHKSGSLEEFVENFIKTWEMEATHKEFYQWTTVDQNEYEVQANGGKVFDSYEAPWVGNYNWLLSTCNKELYDTTKETFESSHGKFRYAFPEGFPFEVLEVFSGPPKITFTWRHWAVFSGNFEGNEGNGETINMTGFGVVTVNEDTKAKRIEIYYNPDNFLEVLRGKRECRDGIDSGVAVGEPLAGGLETLTSMMATVELEEGNKGDSKQTSESIQGKGDGEGGKPSGRCPFSGAT